MIHLEWWWVLALLPLPWLLRRRLPEAEPAAGGALKVPFYTSLAEPARSVRGGSVRGRLAVLWLLWILLLLAASRPQWVGDPTALPQSGRDIMLAVDISGSMEIPDFSLNGHQVNRLTVVKATASDFIARREGDRLGLILFGSRAYLQTPLTFDRATVQSMLDDATIGLAGKETAIGDAIGLAIKRMRAAHNDEEVLVLLSDGANTAGEVAPAKATQLAAQSGLRIYTIGLGADQLRIQVPTLFGTQVVNPSSELDETMLRTIAESTGGEYFRAKDTAGLEAIYEELDRLEPHASDSATFRPRRSLFHWPLGAALLLSAVMAAERLPRRRGSAMAPSPADGAAP